MKYRTWDKKEQKMIHGKLAMAIDIFTNNFAYRLKDVELMEYTQVKDVNDKLICEGDVVKYIKKGVTVGERRTRRGRGYDTYSIREDVEVIGIVEKGQYTKGIRDKVIDCFMVMTDMNAPYMTHFFSLTNIDKPVLFENNLSEPLYSDGEYEIIGNIYENEEYIKSE